MSQQQEPAGRGEEHRAHPGEIEDTNGDEGQPTTGDLPGGGDPDPTPLGGIEDTGGGEQGDEGDGDQ